MTAPLVAWTQEWWDATNGVPNALSTAALAAWWEQIRDAPPVRWAAVRGPLGAAWLTLQRLGWTWPEPGAFLDQHGTRLELRFTSPKMLRHLALDARRQGQEREVASAMTQRGWQRCGEAVSAAAVRGVLASAR